jgi:hypothetical protein
MITQVQTPFEKTRGAFDHVRAVESSPKEMVVIIYGNPALIRTFLMLKTVGYVLKNAL